MLNQNIFAGIFLFLQRAFGPSSGDAILQETSDYLLQEDSGRILLE